MIKALPERKGSKATGDLVITANLPPLGFTTYQVSSNKGKGISRMDFISFFVRQHLKQKAACVENCKVYFPILMLWKPSVMICDGALMCFLFADRFQKSWKTPAQDQPFSISNGVHISYNVLVTLVMEILCYLLSSIFTCIL